MEADTSAAVFSPELRHRYVYPGHPAVIALCVMHEFASLEDAKAKDQKEGNPYVRALSSPNVPGAGSHVWAALDLLSQARTLGWNAEQAFEEAGREWKRQVDNPAYCSRMDEGQRQADHYRQAFLDRFDTWMKPPAPAAEDVRRPRPR